uniref:sphingomyelin phosphodiesterase n=1 Tax=Plectus sambesii TaxID=2011161 RepID=A0A914UW04_9BILA
MRLSVLTLNCWGIPYPYFGSKDRALRFDKIAGKVAESNYDFVSFQEVWDEADFERLKGQLGDVLPYAHYFHSGVIGSGVCVFSRHKIVGTLLHRFSLNGYAHHIHRGDWFGGKVVGLAKVRLEMDDGRPLLVHFYATHIHAEYDRDNDLYLPHRTLQAFELADFVRHTSEGADLSLVVGDLNLEPGDLGQELVLVNAGLNDAWTNRPGAKDSANDEGMTSDKPNNCYTPERQKLRCPKGKRIDYIMYNHNPAVKLTVDSCEVTMEKIASDSPINFSDHAAVTATFKLHSVGDARSNGHGGGNAEERRSMLRPLLERSIEIFNDGLQVVKTTQRHYILAIAFLLLILFITIDVELMIPRLAILAMMGRFATTVVLAYCTWHGIIGLRIERKALMSAKNAMVIYLSDSNN